MTKPMTHTDTVVKGSLIRPAFSPGLLLEDDDLTAGVSYTRHLMQMMFRSLFGCGVICGLEVSATPICNGRALRVDISPGLGLDSLGNPIELRCAKTLEFDPLCDDWPETIWVTACYAETQCRPRDLVCGEDGEGQSSYTRFVSGVVMELHRDRPDCACSCVPAGTAKPKGGCGCCEDVVPTSGKDQPSAESVKNPDLTLEDSASVRGPLTYENPCYADHMNGVCDCGCGSNCILIGKIDVTIDNNIMGIGVDTTAIRRIRPVLIGQLKPHSALPANATSAQAPAPVDEIKTEVKGFKYLLDAKGGVSRNQTITYSAKDKTVEQILDEMLKKPDLGYIVISKKGNAYDGLVQIRKSKERGTPKN